MRCISLFVLSFLSVSAIYAQQIKTYRPSKVTSKSIDSTRLSSTRISEKDSTEKPVTTTALSVAYALRKLGTDTIEERPQGVIVVRKPALLPYIRVEYKIAPMLIKSDAPVSDGEFANENSRQKNTLFFDTVYYKNTEFTRPQKILQLGLEYAERLSYIYSPLDTPRIDTFCVIFWIDKKDRIKGVYADSSKNRLIPPDLLVQLDSISRNFSIWGKVPGTIEYIKPKFWGLIKERKVEAQDFYCSAQVIVSSRPITPEHRLLTESRASGEDYLINPPPTIMQEQMK